MEKEIEITGADMRLDGVVSAARGGKPVRLAHQVRENLSETRRYIEDNWLTDQAPPIYAFNTGVGGRKNIRITQQEMEAFQVNLMRAAAAGAGEPMPDEVVRAMMLLRVNAFATNHSGVRVEIVERLVDMLNKGITPVVSSKGSVGASGDLAPLALMSAAMVGAAESKVRFQGAVMAAPEAFRRAGMAETIDLKAKELQHCTLQLWIPDDSSEVGLYVGSDEHGIALCDLPLTGDGQEQIDMLDAAFKQEGAFDKLSAIAMGYWPIVLAACHHHRLPVPPQFWRPIVAPLATE